MPDNCTTCAREWMLFPRFDCRYARIRARGNSCIGSENFGQPKQAVRMYAESEKVNSLIA